MSRIQNHSIVNTSNEKIIGNHNIINGSNRKVVGNHNRINGADSNVVGNHNIVNKSNCKVVGNHNTINGDNCKVTGKFNKINGKNCDNSESTGINIGSSMSFTMGGSTFTSNNNTGNLVQGSNVVMNISKPNKMGNKKM
jgi:hypothetical protein